MVKARKGRAKHPDAPAHGGERVAAALEAYGVRWIFTLCGGHISPILVAAKRRGIRIVDTRDEVTAVFAADAAARLTGAPGVAAVTAGPGITNTITALKNAQLAQSPVLLLGGAAPTALQGRGALQDIEQAPLVEPHVKLVKQVKRVADLGPAVEEALVASLSGVPGPTFVECPVDLLYDEELIRGWYADAAGKGTSIADRFLQWYLGRHADKMFEGSGGAYSPHVRKVPAPVAGDTTVTLAADALRKAERPLMVLGSQALVDAGEAEAVAKAVEQLGVPVYLSGMARGLLGRDSPLQMRHARRKALREADCVLLAGVPCDFRLDYGKHVRRSATLIAANRSTKDARLNRTADIEAIGDAGRFLVALAHKAHGIACPDWFATLSGRDAEREAEIDAQAAASGKHVNPLAFFRALEQTAGDNAVFVADGGDFVGTASYILHPRAPLTWLDPGAFGTLGVGAGFALGAKLVRPEADVWIVYGDGAAGYSLAEADTFVRHQLGVAALIGNDAGWTQIAREQVEVLHDAVGTALAPTEYERAAAGLGACGLTLAEGDDVDAVLGQARALARGGRAAYVNARIGRSAFREGSLSM